MSAFSSDDEFSRAVLAASSSSDFLFLDLVSFDFLSLDLSSPEFLSLDLVSSVFLLLDLASSNFLSLAFSFSEDCTLHFVSSLSLFSSDDELSKAALAALLASSNSGKTNSTFGSGFSSSLSSNISLDASPLHSFPFFCPFASFFGVFSPGFLVWEAGPGFFGVEVLFMPLGRRADRLFTLSPPFFLSESPSSSSLVSSSSAPARASPLASLAAVSSLLPFFAFFSSLTGFSALTFFFGLLLVFAFTLSGSATSFSAGIPLGPSSSSVTSGKDFMQPSNSCLSRRSRL